MTNTHLFTLGKLAVVGVLGVVATVLAGHLTMIDAVKRVDEAVFDAVVPWLQGLPGVTSFSKVVTDMGAIQLNMILGGVVGLLALVRRRSPILALLAVAIFFGAHKGHSVVINLVDGSSPTEHVIGNAGPYYSGGVVRVITLVGFSAAILFGVRNRRWVLGPALGLGLLEAFTRLAVGRHWPADLLASIPIGLGLVWLFCEAGKPWLTGAANASEAPDSPPAAMAAEAADAFVDLTARQPSTGTTATSSRQR